MIIGCSACLLFPGGRALNMTVSGSNENRDYFRTEKPALLIIDMVKDNLEPEHPLPITEAARGITGPINSLVGICRDRGWPVIFSTDAYHEDDFIFTGRMQPHSLAGTRGAEIAGSLDYRPGTDTWLPKPRFSAFFQTGLDKILREQKVTLCAVAGITTNFCVLATALDAICHNFKAVLLEDCTAAYPEINHERTVEMYRKNPLYPLLRVASAGEFIQCLAQNQAQGLKDYPGT